MFLTRRWLFITAGTAVFLLSSVRSSGSALRFPVGDPSSGSPYTISQKFQDAPFILNGKTISGHLGEDWAVDVGTNVFPIAPGHVVRSRDFQDNWCKVVIIAHENLVPGRTIYSLYAHLISILVGEGDDVIDVTKPIGLSGGPQCGYPPHLHFEIKEYHSANITPGSGYTDEPALNVDLLCHNDATFFRPSSFILGQIAIPSLLGSMSDKFDGDVLNINRWGCLVPPSQGASVTLADINQHLEVLMGTGVGGGGIVSQCSISGDFDVQVDYILLNWPINNNHSVRLGAYDLGGVGVLRFSASSSELYELGPGSTAHTPTNDTAGQFRLVRTGSTISGFFRTGSNWTFLGSETGATSATRFNLDLGTNGTFAPGGIVVAFDNFQVNAGSSVCPAAP
jgi:hypothetical protein